ncbi:MAG: ATP-binding protein, partial [Candidatus Eremiobacterota bacterium]
VARGPVDAALATLAQVLAAVLGTGSALALAASYALASGLTRPLEQVARSARRVGPHNLAERVPPLSPDEEFVQLRSALNGMLAELERAFTEQDRMLQSQRQFLADASHELRTPLANLTGTLEVALRRDRTAEEYRVTLQQALQEAQRLARLVSDLLALSRADLAPLGLRFQPLDLGELCRGALQAWAARFEARRVQAVYRGPETAPARGDRDRLREVLDNLLDNAHRYAPEGTGLEVRLEPGWRIGVLDEGPGLAPEELERVFERFYRSDPSRSRASGGTGLGLPISRAIAEAHGGALRAEPGPGGRFWLELPDQR